jgi:hypothetical protein
MKRFLLTAALLAAAAAMAQAYNLKAPFAEKPIFLTSAGQSADIEMVKALIGRVNLPYTMNAKAKAADLAASGAKTVLLAIGGSSKGLGAAGVSTDAELERIQAIIQEAQKRNLKVIGVHIGGQTRRGELSDKFTKAVVPFCDYVVIVADGNKDGLFSKLCGSKIPLDQVDKITKVADPIVKAFK